MPEHKTYYESASKVHPVALDCHSLVASSNSFAAVGELPIYSRHANLEQRLLRKEHSVTTAAVKAVANEPE